RPRQFIKPDLWRDYPTWNESNTRASLDRAIKHRAKGWINDKELAFIKQWCRDRMLKLMMQKDAKIAALRAKEAKDTSE
ncbi:MAG: hypothetical protein Q7R41_16875, partial [Phycisphaerales bacterium]|nr:hypothetical protein [Phycisphaerales bacterium]